MEKLTASEKEDLKMIMNISYSLLDNFIKLRNLETNGGHGSEEFTSTINSLQSTITLEDSLYGKINSTKIDEFLSELNGMEKFLGIQSEINVAKTKVFDNLVRRRVIARLLDIKYGTKQKQFEFDNVCYEIKKDIIKTILTLLNIYLNDYKYQPIQKELLNFKYNLGFIFKDIEADFIEHNFSINPKLYWTTYFVTDFHQIPREVVDNFKHSFSSLILDNEFNFVLVQSNYSLRDTDTYAKAIISQILIRVGLLFGPDNLDNDLKEQFEKFIGINKMMNGDNTSENLVMEAINLSTADKEIPKVISLKL